MATPRSTVSDVERVIDTSAPSEVIQGFLEDAADILATRDTVDLDEDHLATIEKYLAAHFIRLNYERSKTEITAMDATVRKPDKGGGIGLRATAPGQAVLELDTTGLFARASSPGGFTATASPHSGNYDRSRDDPEYSERDL